MSFFSRKNTQHLAPYLLIGSIFVGLIFATFFVYEVERTVTLKVPKQFALHTGQGIWDIALTLKKQDLIRSPFIFILYAWEKGVHRSLQAGEYQIEGSFNIKRLVDILSKGQVFDQSVRVTIPEGYNLFEIDRLLSEKGLIKAGELLNATFNFQFSTLNQLSTFDFELPTCNLCNLLEGFLFPDTYVFEKGQSLEEIIKKMLANFEKKAKPLLDFLTPLHFDTLTFRNIDILTLASLLEKETSSYKDRQIIAGILYKRLKAGFPLQVDASVLYAKTLLEGSGVLSREHNPVTKKDLEINSPYNTYKYKGLPPGPICNPGLSAIKAALHPINTEYWYYLHTFYGQTVYSKTYEEHIRAKAKYLK